MKKTLCLVALICQILTFSNSAHAVSAIAYGMISMSHGIALRLNDRQQAVNQAVDECNSRNSMQDCRIFHLSEKAGFGIFFQYCDARANCMVQAFSGINSPERARATMLEFCSRRSSPHPCLILREWQENISNPPASE